MTYLQIILLSLLLAPLAEQVGLWVLSPSNQGQGKEDRTVNLYVGITDREGNASVDVRPDEIEVYEEGIQQKIISSALEDAPLSIGILLDISSSQKKHFPAVLAAVKSFIENSAREGEFFLVTFGEEVKLLSDFADRQTTLTRLVTPVPERRSKVYDAIHYGLEKAQQGRFARRALLLITDGQEGGSQISHRELFKAIKRSDVQIYCLGVGNTNSGGWDDPGNFQIGHLLLEELAKLTGGIAYDKDKPEQLLAEAKLIAQQMWHQYRIAYQPSMGTREKKWRKIKVKTTASSSHVKIRARQGHWF